MRIKDIFSSRKQELNQLMTERKPEREQIVLTCPECGYTMNETTARRKMKICTSCGHYFAMSPGERVHLIGDEKSFKRQAKGLKTVDPLNFPGYLEKLQKATKNTGEEDAILAGVMKIKGISVAVAFLDTRVLMGSMGTVVGEKVTLITEYARKAHLPLIIYSASGGARMQEGIYSLMQMAKTSAAIQRFRDDGGLYISILCHPTTGGVSASFAFLGDLIFAEPGALIGFAGPRVIAQTIGEELPEGFQSASSQVDNGMIDGLLPRESQRETLYKLLVLHGYKPESQWKKKDNEKDE